MIDGFGMGLFLSLREAGFEDLRLEDLGLRGPEGPEDLSPATTSSGWGLGRMGRKP